MKYVPVEGETIPKHIKYGPRRSEGLVLSTHEWWKITDHLVKEQREREMLAVLKAKEEAKKGISSKMTSNWKNTLASFKAQGNQKRIANKEKENQEKIDQYNEILLKRKKDKEEILVEVKKILNENKNFVKDLKSALLFSTVLQEWQKQIELKKDIKKEEKKKETELFIKYKKDAEEFEKQKLEEKFEEKTKRKNQKEDLDNQVINKKLRRQNEADNFVQEQQDLKNMRIEDEEIRKCDAIQKKRKKELLARYCKKTEAEADYEKTIQLEEEEENKINDLYKLYEKKFEREKKEKEKKMREDEIIKRNKITEKLVQKLAETSTKEDEIREAAFEEKERATEREEKEKEKLKKQMLEDYLELKRKGEEKMAREKYETKERKKWEMMQAHRRREMHEEWKNCRRKKQKESEEATRAAYEAQAGELQERRKKELEELFSPAQDDFLDREEFVKYRKDVLDFVQEQKMPEYPVLKAVTKVENEFGMRRNEEKEKTTQKTQNVSKEDCRQPQISKGLLASGCYCFKY